MKILNFLLEALLQDSMTGKFTLTKSFSLIFVILTVIIEIFALQKCDLLIELVIINLAFVSVSLGFRTILLRDNIKLHHNGSEHNNGNNNNNNAQNGHTNVNI